jgi:O-antigen/teichoic acid export membrane protein
MAAVAILGSVATLRYELALALPKRHDIALNVLALTLLCVAATALISGLAISVAGDQLAQLMGRSDMHAIAWLVPFGVLSIGTYTAVSQWSVRHRSFKTVAKTKVVQAVGQTILQIGAAFTPLATFGLLLGNLLGQSAGITSLSREIVRRDRAAMRGVKLSRIWLVARHYWEFPAFSLAASVAFTAGQQLPSLIMFSMFGAGPAGFLLLAQRISMMPASVLGSAVSQSLYRDVAEARRSAEMVGNVVLKPTRVLTNLVIGPAVLAALVAPWGTAVLFGHNWGEAGEYLRWLAPWVATTLTFAAMTPVVSVMGFQRLGLAFQVGSLAISTAAMVLMGQRYGAVAAIAAFSLSKTITVIVYRLHMFHMLKISPVPLLFSYLLQTAGFIAAFGGALAVANWGSDAPWKWGTAAALALAGFASYGALNFVTLREWRKSAS